MTSLVPETTPARWVDETDTLREIVASAGLATRYALDTEFHRERSYYPKLALVQLAWDDQLVLIDPLHVDIRELVPLFAGPGLAVLHAAQQDLDVLTHACGAVPARLADTQLLAGFLGHSTPSLSSLVNGELQIRLPKADRLTDWLRRPLTDDQMTYAASDVAHLFDLYDRLAGQLEELGRLDWALAECEELRAAPRRPQRPGDRLAAPQGRPGAQAPGPGRGQGRGRVAGAPGRPHGHAGPLRAARPGRPGHRPAGPPEHARPAQLPGRRRASLPGQPRPRRSWRRWPRVASTPSTCPSATTTTSTGRSARR